MKNSRIAVVGLAACLWWAGCGDSEQAEWAPISGTRNPVDGERSQQTGAGSGAGSGASPDAPMLADNPLLGSWHQEVGTCAYTHSFSDSGSYSIAASTGEAVEANYTLAPPRGNRSRYRLEFTITSDNNEIDCEGDRIDETGNRRTVFIEVENSARVQIYSTGSGGSPRATWRRL